LREIDIRSLLKWAGLSPGSFYYKRSGQHKGVKPGTHSVNRDGVLVENRFVVKDIEETLSQEFCCYGYRNMTGELKDRGGLLTTRKYIG
jgi:putative transposase